MQSNDLYLEQVITQHPMPENARLKKAYFQIAGHLLKLIIPITAQVKDCLPTFENFVEECSDENKVEITIQLCCFPAPADNEEKTLLSDLSIVWGDRFRFEASSNGYVTTVQSEFDDLEWKMYSTKDFKQSIIYAIEDELNTTSMLSWLMMLAYGQAVVSYGTTLLHASAVEKDGKGFAFLGKSGTGKSTHSQLWIQHIAGTNLLNDDNPAIRIADTGRVIIYGTPWSGKTSCYRNVGVELTGIIRLEQGSSNSLDWTEGKEALITLLPSTTSIRWNRRLFNRMVSNLEVLISKVPVGKLTCLPDGAAAHVCYEEIIKR